MKKKSIYLNLTFVLFLSLSCFYAPAQTPSDVSMALKTIQIADKELPIVLEDEIKGGHHQLAGYPWETTNGILTTAVLEAGMLATNSSTNQTYRYNGNGTSNIETDWTPVFIVTNWEASKTYQTGEIVAAETSGGRMLFQALSNNTNKEPKDNTDTWVALGPVNHMSIVYPSATYPTTGTPLFPEAHPEDQTIINVGQTVVIIVDDYTLPAATSKTGETYIIKNKRSNDGYFPPQGDNFESNAQIQDERYYAKSQVKVSAPSGETIEGKGFKYLYQTNDFITLLSDGTNWIMINEGPTGSAYLYNGNPPVSSSDIDAIYWGRPGQKGSMRTISYVGYSTDESKNRVYQRLQHFDGSDWSTMSTSVVDY